jgi:hypothetical protein
MCVFFGPYGPAHFLGLVGFKTAPTLVDCAAATLPTSRRLKLLMVWEQPQNQTKPYIKENEFETTPINPFLLYI